ncbi:hypothetical protein [Kutzneria sp. 744]|uniref:hypothetical protein n=1 Tax=Kutzneria sp. (strain 744) TaxID=345341 RepID=UPI0003EEABCE|nr:hypothetical protein [Kutzneria sp. 744]EWM14619.1 hypothetical protein KUTG_04923 [Kutzneria sp. 744]
MHANDFPGIDDIAEPTAANLDAIVAAGTLTALDAEFHYLISHPRLSAEFAKMREQGPTASASLLDGSARARRDRRIAQRALGSTVRVLRVHFDAIATAPVSTGEAAA